MRKRCPTRDALFNARHPHFMYIHCFVYTKGCAARPGPRPTDRDQAARVAPGSSQRKCSTAKSKRRKGAKGEGAAAAALGAPALARAQGAADWPKGAVKIIVPFAAGSATDIMARIIADDLRVALGQPFVIDNKPGAGGNLGAAEVARAAPARVASRPLRMPEASELRIDTSAHMPPTSIAPTPR